MNAIHCYKQQERCAPTKLNKQPHLHLRSRDSVQPDVMDVGVERTFSPQNFSVFPWEQVDDLWATKSEDVGLIVRTVSFQDFQRM